MFLAWYEYRTYAGVMRETGHALETCQRWRKEDTWDKQAENIDGIVRSMDAKTTARRRSDHIVIARSAVTKMAEDLTTPGKKLTFTTQDFDRLCRLIEFLSGEDESSHGVGADNESREEMRELIDSYTDQKRREIIKNFRRERSRRGD